MTSTVAEYETLRVDQPILMLNYSLISPTTSSIAEKENNFDSSSETQMTNTESYDRVSLVTISSINSKNVIKNV